MAIYGYHRTSTEEQHLDRGISEITEYCRNNGLELRKIFTDQETGKNFNRPKYQTLKEDILMGGDCLIVTELDRLGRNKEATLKELQYFKDAGIRIMILEIPTTLRNYSSMENSLADMLMETINNMLIEMYATFAHAEMIKREKRQREGIEAMKERGEWHKYGRPKAIDFKKFAVEYKKVIDGTLRPFECMRLLGMKKPTFYKYVKRYKAENNI
ncbi:MAG: recombinase family protein [Tannerella sp.]|jgi:DNA invertase Pin-like site-specific DNA recombinase|nr:recombinase family protein [Tannerella sp.]